MELIRSKIGTNDIPMKMMYADDLAIIAESKQELQEVLEEWKGCSRSTDENEPGEDRIDVGWTPERERERERERGVEHQVGW